MGGLTEPIKILLCTICLLKGKIVFLYHCTTHRCGRAKYKAFLPARWCYTSLMKLITSFFDDSKISKILGPPRLFLLELPKGQCTEIISEKSEMKLTILTFIHFSKFHRIRWKWRSFPTFSLIWFLNLPKLSY